jgi:flagellar protein FliL
MADVPVLAPAAEAPKGKSNKKTLIIVLVLAIVLLACGGVGAWFAFASHDKKPQAARKEPALPALYMALDPPFVVNFEAEQQVRFLQVTVQLMSRDPATIELLKANDPVVRNDLLLLFAGQKYTVIATREGKEALRQQTLEAIRKIVTGSGGKPEKVEAVYFTSFVMQ